MRYRKWFLLGMFLVGVFAATISLALGATFTTIDVPGASFTIAFGINDRGQIVGIYGGAAGIHGFLLD